MISYAQNAEDVVLDRVLPQEQGFYVDVGAASPDASSVTRHFYDKGWRGINVEPRRDACAALREKRRRDLNLQIAIGAEEGTCTFYVVEEDPDLSTIDPGDLSFLRAKGHTFHAEQVPVRTLDSVLAMAEVESIDFLKIDAEGAERAVLSGLDLHRWRPKVVVVEAVKPWSRDRTDSEWRSILEDHGYVEGLFDGVNLFFAPADDTELLDRLVPASALDHFRSAEIVALERELAWHRSKMAPAPPSRPEPLHPQRPIPPPPPARLAVVGPPGPALDRLATALGAANEADVVPVTHPAGIDWSGLPGRAVMVLPAARTDALEAQLRTVGARVVSPARHPWALLCDAYESHARARANGPTPTPPPDGFVEWALGPEAGRLLAVTTSWWSTPATIRLRYEDLVADPDGGLAPLLRRLRMVRPPDLSGLGLLIGAPPHLSDEQVERLLEAHGPTWARLGYR